MSEAAAATIVELLEAVSGVERDGLRFVDRQERERWFAWRTVVDRARRTAHSLSASGVRAGDRVALILPTGPAFFDGLFGALLCGAIPAPMYPPVRLGRLDEYQRRTATMLGAIEARVVLTDRRVARIVGEAIDLAGVGLGCVTLADDVAPDTLGATPPRPALTPDDPALIQFSSGTTVDPKPVVLSHGAILAHVRTLNALWPAGDGRRASGVSWLPLYHDMGLIGCVMSALELSTTLTLLPPEAFVARPALWLRAISRHRGTVSPAPNFAYALCTERIADHELEGVDLSSWTVALNGAEPVVPATLHAFAARFSEYGFDPAAMTPVYGLSEATLAVTFGELGHPPRIERFDRGSLASGTPRRARGEGRALVSVGRPLPGVSLSILDAEGAPCPDGRIGRLHVAGPSLMSGYWERPLDTRRSLRDGRLDTGDLGFLYDGELFVTGRAKEMLLVRGRNVAPEELERAVRGIDGVRAGCVAAVGWLPDDAERESVALLVEARRGTPRGRTAAIGEACEAAVLRETGVALDEVAVLAAGSLPRTSSGKLRRGEALRRYLDGSLAPPGHAGAQVARAWIRSVIRRPGRAS